jgi:glutamine cyclotransferase
MHSGLPKINSFPPFYQLMLLLFISLALSCDDRKANRSITFESPNQGDTFDVGEEIKVKLNVPEAEAVAMVKYLIDGKIFATKANQDSVLLASTSLPLGYRMISAVVKYHNKLDTLTTNIVLKTNRVPKKIAYSVVNTFPHNTQAYTEGLGFVDGKLLESTGEKGASVLKYVDLKSGKDLQKIQLAPQYFGEGSVKIGNKIIMLTWQENIGLIFDAKTLKQLGTFPYQNSREGWGLTFDGKTILRTDGTNRIWRMNAKSFKEEGYIEVYDQTGPVLSLNELEYIEGKIYANVYLTNKIVRIDPRSGAVEAQLDLSDLVPKNYYKTTEEQQNNVLNGIAWDEKGKRLFVGGKKWPRLYEIKLVQTDIKD